MNAPTTCSLDGVGLAYREDHGADLFAGGRRVALEPGELERLVDDDPGGAALLARLGAGATSAEAPEFPLVIGEYVLTALLGRGSFGTVSAARDRVTGERVAIKVLREVDAWTLQAFKNEARFLVDVVHPGLVAADELIELDGRLALVMRLVFGRDLCAALAEAAGAAGPLRDPGAVAGLCASLLRAVAALHAAGIVHMDLKPGNVLVDDTGAVRVLDFGLSRLREAPAAADDGVSGTPRYMAPEQWMAAAPAPAMDVYAIGMMLYEALTGVTPFDGAGQDVVLARLNVPPVPIASRRSGLAAPWDTLIDAMLARRPEARPGMAEILGRVAGVDAAAVVQAGAIVGRDGELARLAAAWADVQAGGTALCLVSGEPGIGKTELVRQFAAGLRATGEGAAAWARCYERESIAFKALDPVIDRLCEVIRADPALRASVAALPEARALRQVFRALATVTDAEEPPQALDRARIAAALGRILAQVCERLPLLLVIDDTQWGDADSVDLLHHMLAGPQAARILLVLVHRVHAWSDSPFAWALEGRIAKGVPFQVVRIALTGLDDRVARRLVATRLGVAEDDPRVRPLVNAAAGNPFLLEQCTSGAAVGDEQEPLQALVTRRLERWPAPVRAVVSVAAVAGSAVPLHLLAAAADAPVPDRSTMAELRDAGLLRLAVGPGGRPTVCYHDLVREALRTALGRDERVYLHGRLADTLAHAGGDPGTIAWHLSEAGEHAAARAWALRGAAAAERAQAFARAAELLALALADADHGPGEQRTLRRRIAAAQQADGRGLAAADAYLELATTGDEDEARELRRLGAEAALLAGGTERGLGILAPVLAALRLAAPARGFTGGLRLATGMAWLAARGWGLRPRAAVDAAEAERSDTCWVAARGLVFIDPLPGLEFLVRSLRHGARSGSRLRLGRAMGVLAAGVFDHVPGLARLADRWLATLAVWGEEDAYLAAIAPLWSALQAFGRGELGRALELGRTALDRTATLPGAAWERVQAAAIVGRTLRSQGQYTACIELGRAHLQEAERRGDRYAQMLFGDVQVLPLIARGAAAEAAARIDWLAEQWLPDRYTVQSFYVMLHRAYADLHAGRPLAASARLTAQRADFRRAGGYRIVFSRLDHNLLELRIALAIRGEPPAGLLRCEPLLARLRKEASPEAHANAALAAAVLATRRGDRPAALAALDRAIDRFECAGIAMEAEVAKLRRSELTGDAPARAAATLQMRRLGAHDPPRWAEVMAPSV